VRGREEATYQYKYCMFKAQRVKDDDGSRDEMDWKGRGRASSPSIAFS